MFFNVLKQTVKWGLAPRYNRYLRALDNPLHAQNSLLLRIQNSAKNSYLGDRYGILSAHDYEGFCKRVPLQGWQEIEPLMQMAVKQQRDILGRGPIVGVEKTSGSTSRQKIIPYNSLLLGSFQSMFQLWLMDILQYGPKLETGTAFLWISPNHSAEQLSTELTGEQDYLSGLWKKLIQRFLVPTHSLVLDQTSECFYQSLAKCLLRQESLEIVSIWNPTLFSYLLDYIVENKQALSRELGGLRRQVLQVQDINWQQVWPKLKFVSLWDEGNSRSCAERLRQRLPHVSMQGKGLLATESPMTIPLISVGKNLPLVNTVYYEFVGDDGEVRRLHELQQGRDYEIVITNFGGFWRYRIGDLVRCGEPYLGTPSLQFLRRKGEVSDLVGEKLGGDYIAKICAEIYGQHLLVPTIYDDGSYGYTLLTDRPAAAMQFEEKLNEIYHYRQARILKQLHPLQTKIVQNVWLKYVSYQQKRGRKIGDVKPALLMGRPVAQAHLAELAGEPM